MEYIKEYGDVLFLDMTNFRSYLCWNIVPLVVLNYNKNIKLCGFLASSSYTKDVYMWLFEQLLKNELFGIILRTIISDSDTALLPALKTINDNTKDRVIHSMTCTWHKKKKLISMLSRLTISHESKEMVKNGYSILTSTRSPEKFNEIFEKISSIHTAVRSFLEQDFMPHKENLTLAFSKETFNMGYTVSSPSESANHMIKSNLKNKDFSLIEIREFLIK
ncbi:hypothetical protein TRFO_29442 [Tritrichomonas foetus]|uniref:MULE transposase domain-containing protein n=1 Tax=Tritrichomonas foetus TaxID=1144522 RepID=A0A1J4K0I1_9EUKA|nr:hypothetical protein TRFO_29442 [Tritrichomonas foetus]|eukprot:OHT03246.1 hypothetical protein TRFO_29442 [Tritrichomonas foetus]